MGMDQHLCRIRSFKNDHVMPVVTVNGAPLTRVYEVREEVAYWRRAHTINEWLKTHCNNEDDSFLVKRETLTALLTLCQGVVAVYEQHNDETEVLGINVFEAMSTVEQLSPILGHPETGPGYITFEYVAEY